MNVQSLQKVGAAPGSLHYTGKYQECEPSFEWYEYSQDGFSEKKSDDLNFVIDGLKNAEPKNVTWLIYQGLSNVEKLSQISEIFQIHTLTLEDILNVRQRPRLEDHWDYYYAVMNHLRYSEEEEEIFTDQVSVLLKDEVVIVFLEGKHDFFEPLINRLRSGKGKIKQQKADYLFYLILDALVDSNYILINDLTSKFDQLEETLEEADSFEEALSDIHFFKAEIQSALRKLKPLKEMSTLMSKRESDLFEDYMFPYYKDLADHVVQILDSLTGLEVKTRELREMVISLNSLKLSSIMKKLTIMATIFMPLTFIVGVYGMNFKHMPELEHAYGYFISLLGMLLFAVLMTIYMKRKNWF